MVTQNRVALITGGGTGIGLGAARALALEGVTAVLFGPDPPILERASATLRTDGGTAHTVTGDVASSDSVRALIDEIRTKFGRLDIIVNSAAIQPYGTVATMAEADWDRVMGVNLKGIYLTAHHGIPLMKRRGGGSI